ncbi:MAG: FeoA family protein [Massiliimalia sp.]|jgi:ferrous iron transport protein A
MMPLTMMQAGESTMIRKISGSQETRRFLENLGFLAGTHITILSTIGGNVIVHIKDSRIAINQDMAKHIMVQ